MSKSKPAPAPAIQQEWDLVIEPKSRLLDLNLKDIWHYRDLILVFVKRDLVVTYKQTILGPLWFLIQPIVSTLIFMAIFTQVAKLPTDGIDPFLFYLSGTIFWNYFASCINGTSNTFVANAGLFGKVYFPRISVPISITLSNSFKFFIQFALFLCAYILLSWPQYPVNWLVLLIIPLLIQMAMLGLGVGLFVSALVTKYRDIGLLMGFFIQFWMYATPVIYPFSQVPEKYKILFLLNPMTSVLEIIRFAFFSAGTMNMNYWILAWIQTIIVLFIGLIIFNKVEKRSMDLI